MKYRVHLEMSSGSRSQCVAYIVGGSSQGVARARAVEMAQQHYPEYDSFVVYHAEELKK